MEQNVLKSRSGAINRIKITINRIFLIPCSHESAFPYGYVKRVITAIQKRLLTQIK